MLERTINNGPWTFQCCNGGHYDDFGQIVHANDLNSSALLLDGEAAITSNSDSGVPSGPSHMHIVQEHISNDCAAGTCDGKESQNSARDGDLDTERSQQLEIRDEWERFSDFSDLDAAACKNTVILS